MHSVQPPGLFTTDELRNVSKIPSSMIVVGGGVIGTELACILATLDTQVTIIEGRDRLLGFVDQEINEAFQTAIRRAGITLLFNETPQQIQEVTLEDGTEVQVSLASGKQVKAEILLYAIGRQGQCDGLGLENIGIETDKRGLLSVNEHYQTAVEHIYAIGDVIGFPALAATGMEQGRIAASHAFGVDACSLPHLMPYGIYAIPEISMVGKTESQLTDEGIPYQSGIALWSELARGQLLGDEIGMMKILIHQNDRKILGVHCMGTGATELIHIGQMAMAFEATVDTLINNVFNYPTLAEAYKVAGYNALNKLR